MIRVFSNNRTKNKLIDDFNNYISEQRGKYHSLFLTNYRENGRKRISFSLIYKIVSYLLIDL